tara:strand:+ start:458 stop:667 length:210 start_codon:yes stop_codon:yes gene_type:complete
VVPVVVVNLTDSELADKVIEGVTDQALTLRLLVVAVVLAALADKGITATLRRHLGLVAQGQQIRSLVRL